MTVIAAVALAVGAVGLAQEQSHALDDILAVGDSGGVSVLLAGDGPLEGTMFMLSNPPRVVLDLPGVVSRVSKRVHAVDQGGVQRVRVAQFQVTPRPITRVVVDLSAADMPYHLESTAKGAILRVGAEPAQQATVAADATTVPSAPQAAPAEETPAEVVPAPPTTAADVKAALESAAQPAPAVAAASTPVETASQNAATTPAQEPAPVPAPVVEARNETPAAAVQPAAASASEPPAVEIKDEPYVAPVPAEPAPQVQAKAAPSATLAAPPSAEPTPSENAPADSPWTSTPRAMVEQAPPVVDVPVGETEVASEEKRFTGEPISLELKDADVRDVLRTFAKITGLNVVVDPDVRGSVTVNLENVPWDQCLDIILKINRLDYVVENNVLRVARMDTLTSEKRARAEYNKQFEETKPLRTITKALSYAKAADVSKVLTSQGFLLSPRGAVVVDERTNMLMIRDTADRIEGILNLIDQLDRPNPQVIIEARIVETTRTFSHALGVTWGFTGLGDPAHGTTTGWKFPNTYSVGGQVNLAQPGNGILSMTFGDILDSFNLDFQLSAAEAAGLVKIVSTPKVTAQNNQSASIQSGVMLPIQTVANNTVTVQYVNATLSLQVTPQITAEGTVLLDINVQKREPLQGINLQEGRNAPISTRDAQTTVMVRDGGTTVIGGIYQLNDQDSTNGVPGLSKLPIIGSLFRNKAVSGKHDELLIFITPRIVKY